MCGTAGYHRIYAVPKSFTCASGYFLPANANTCYACPSGYTCNGGTFYFNAKLAQGITKTQSNTYISTTATNACAANTVPGRVYAIPKSFTCASGYFLPANANTCYACPTGYTCNGGTFYFSSKLAQGITRINNTVLSTNEHYTCAANLGNHVMNGSFTPNNVSLTWDYGVGNTTTSTCTYDGLIILPPDPEPRPGYAFKGWKLVTNE